MGFQYDTNLFVSLKLHAAIKTDDCEYLSAQWLLLIWPKLCVVNLNHGTIIWSALACMVCRVMCMYGLACIVHLIYSCSHVVMLRAWSLLYGVVCAAFWHVGWCIVAWYGAGQHGGVWCVWCMVCMAWWHGMVHVSMVLYGVYGAWCEWCMVDVSMVV